MTSKKSYHGHLEVSNFIKSGFRASIIREKPDIVTEFASGEWGVARICESRAYQQGCCEIFNEIEQSKNFFVRIRRLVQGKLFGLFV